MRHSRVLGGSVAAFSALVLILLMAAAVRGQEESKANFVGLDANPTGNTATSLETIDYCARLEADATTQVDLVVDEIPEDRPAISFEMHVTYDPKIVEVTAIETEGSVLGSEGQYQPTTPFTDPLPDSDGDFRVSIIDVASNATPGANMETGPGVLTRITFRGKAAGVTVLGIDADLPNTYPAIFDDQNTIIPVVNIGAAALAVGQDCAAPPAGGTLTPVPTPGPIETPTPGATDGSGTPPAGGDGDGSPAPGPGTPDLSSPSGQATATAVAAESGGNTDDDNGSDGGSTALIIILVAAGLAAAGGGGWALYRWRLRRP